MAHCTRIITKEFPEEIDDCRPIEAKATDFNGKTEVFEWCEGTRDVVLNMYTIGDDLVVVVARNFMTNRMTQHMVQIPCHDQERPPRITVPTDDKSEEIRRLAYTICTRTKTLPGLVPHNCKVTLAMGQVYSGWLLVNVRESYRGNYERRAHLIASNPLHIDRYPDADLSKMVVELSGKANEKALQLFLPILAKNGIFYLLRPQLESSNRVNIATNMTGVIYFLDGNKYRTELVPLGNTDVDVNPEFLYVRSNFVLTQSGGVGYLVFKCPDDVVLKSRRWRWKKKKIAVKMFLSKTTFRFFDSLDDLTDWRWCNRVASKAYDWQDRLEDSLTPPKKAFVYSIDCNHMKLRVIPCEPVNAKRSFDVTINSLARAAPNGAFFLVSLPCHHREYSGKRKSPLIVTVLWEPTNPPSLKEIAQRRVMSIFPEYRTVEFRKRYGLLEYNGEETRTKDAEDVRSMNTSYSLMDVRSGFRSPRSGQSPEQRSTSKSSLLDTTRPLYSSFYPINEKREPLLKSSDGKTVLSILE